MGDFRKAMIETRELLRSNPDDFELHNLMGLVEMGLNNMPRAVLHLERAYRLSARPYIAVNLSTAYIESGNPTKAVTLLNQAQRIATKELYANIERLTHNLGRAYERLGKLQKAETLYVASIEENPIYYLPHHSLAKLYEKVGRPAKSAEQFQKAIELCNRCFNVYRDYADLKIKLGRVSDALGLVEQYLKIENLTDAEREMASTTKKMYLAFSSNRLGSVAR